MTNSSHAPRGGSASALWITLLTVASTVTTVVLACATPFPALAALAAVHMRPRDGIMLMLAAWAASQLVGFCILDYPRDANTIGWSIALATAAIGSVWVAYRLLDKTNAMAKPLQLIASYCAAFVAFKLVVLLWSFGLGGVATALDPIILVRQFARNGAILIGLLALYHALVAIGAPRAPMLAA